MPRVFWVGLVACAVYILVALGSSKLLIAVAQTASTSEATFALGHLVPLPVGIAAGLVFARWSGWWSDIFTQPVTTIRPRRWWMLAIPILLLVGPVANLVQTPWSGRAVGFVLLSAVAFLLVGFGEEFFFRGILRVSLRSHHGELVTILVTSLLFGLGHSLGLLFVGTPVTRILFVVGVTALSGALFYAALRATGTLWVPIVIHALTDFSLRMEAPDRTNAAIGHGSSGTTSWSVETIVTFGLWALLLAVVVSFALEDLAERRERCAAISPTSNDTTR